jgi:hypothetical protein
LFLLLKECRLPVIRTGAGAGIVEVTRHFFRLVSCAVVSAVSMADPSLVK